MYGLIKKLNKKNNKELNYGRDIVISWVSDYLRGYDSVKILDVGCGYGTDLLNISKFNNNIDCFGIETNPLCIDFLKTKNISVSDINIEIDRLPFEDDFFDIVIANQILEHTKELFWIISEVSRVLKAGGVFIVGIPNLASFHNRVLLLLGMQPSSIRPLSAHVRGFVRDGMVEVVENGSFFKLQDFKGSNFYPFPPRIAQFFARVLPGAAATSFFQFLRTNKSGDYLSELGIENFETNYFIGY